MTLQSVAALARTFPWRIDVPHRDIAAWTAEMFEKDPEFTAPERLKEAEAKLAKVEALAEEFEKRSPFGDDMVYRDTQMAVAARRLRECLGEKP